MTMNEFPYLYNQSLRAEALHYSDPDFCLPNNGIFVYNVPGGGATRKTGTNKVREIYLKHQRTFVVKMKVNLE